MLVHFVTTFGPEASDVLHQSLRRINSIGRKKVCKNDDGYPHNGRADKNPYPHDRHADKDYYPHDSNNQCIILRLQLSFAMINVQLMLV